MTIESYFLKANLVLIVAGLIYLILLRNRSSFGVSRIWILSGFVVAIIAPWAGNLMPATESQVFAGTLVEPVIVSTDTAIVESGLPFSITTVLQYGFYLLSAFFLLRFIVGLSRLWKLTQTLGHMRIGAFRIYHLPDNSQPFSFFRLIFLPRNHTFSEVSLHEEQHARLYHSVDLLLSGLLSIVFWINPMYWLLTRELRTIHEFQADRAVLNRGADMKHYQQILLSVAMGSISGLPVNQLKQSFIKKRILMMKQNKSFRLSAVRLMLAIPMLSVALWLTACGSKSTADDNTKKDTVVEKEITKTVEAENEENFQPIEKMPEYPGGQEAMGKFFGSNVKYPQAAKENNIQGTVYIGFTVDEKGKVINPSVKEPVSPELDAEALRVVKLMPKWTPGENEGKPVAVEMTIPVKFKLQ